MPELTELQGKDLQYIWHPCSQMKDYEDFPPLVISKGAGVYLEDSEGKRYLDAISSWWVNLFGHSNPRLNQALSNQAAKLEHTIFVDFSHEAAIELAERIVGFTPPGLNKVFFVDNGSAAVEVALKMSFQYHQQTGKAGKTKFVALSGAYHGETIGALAVGDLDLYSRIYRPLLMETIKAAGPDCFRCRYGLDRTNCQAECFESMANLLAGRQQEISAVIIEPIVQGAAGMRMYAPQYLSKLAKCCRELDINFIADEIAVGFGRTGKMFACEHAGCTPDIMCLSKGLTAGYLPMALVVSTDEIYQAFYDDYVTRKGFLHSHSYSGNALGCAVAVETLKIFADQDVLTVNQRKAQYLKRQALAAVADLPHCGEYRQTGMIGAIELVKNPVTKERFPWRQRVGYGIYRRALAKGLLLRPLGDVLYFMPPYVITEPEIDFMVATARAAIVGYFKDED